MFIDVFTNHWLPTDPVEASPIVCIADPVDHLTHLPANLARELAWCSGISVPTPPPREGVTINVGNGLKSLTSSVVQDVYITVAEGQNPAYDSQCIDVLCTELVSVLAKRRVILIFNDTHELEDAHRKALAVKLWSRLEKLVEHGLLLISVHDPDKLHADGVNFPPRPTLALDLPDYFQEKSDRMQAFEDLTEVCLTNGWFDNRERALGFAEGQLATTKTMNDLQVKLSDFRAGRGVFL